MKTAIKTMLLIACLPFTAFLIFMFIELSNISLVGHKIHTLAATSIQQACVLFSQETYKREDTRLDITQILSIDGTNIGISDDFYGSGNSREQIYQNLYGLSSPFASFTDLDGYWKNYDLLKTQYTSNAVENSISSFYKDALMTPLNVGVPYLDLETVNKIARYNLANLLNGGVIENGRFMNIAYDKSRGEYYVQYKGVDIFLGEDSFKITNISYEVVDLNTEEGKKKFTEYTNMNPDVILKNVTSSSDERTKIAFVGLEYKITMRYSGITPLATLLNNISGSGEAGTELYKVESFDSTSSSNEIAVKSGYADTSAVVYGGGFSGMSDTPRLNRVIYYIIR